MIGLDALAGDLLDAAVDALLTGSAEDPAARPAPERRYVSHGPVVTVDCELLAVNLVKVAPKVVDPRNEPCAIVPEATLMVTLVNCWPKLGDRGQLPAAAEIDEAARQHLVDGRALYGGLTRAWVDGEWPGGGRPCGFVKWGQLEPLAPSGGFAGWRIDVRVQV